MDYDASDSGTNDDLPSSHQNRGIRGIRITANGRAISDQHHRVKYNDMEAQIHQLEQEAYAEVIRAFKAQSDAISWEKASLITELRKELRVSDEEHRDTLNCLDKDDIIHKLREWRQEGGHQAGQNYSAPSPVSASHKRKKISLSLGGVGGGKLQILPNETPTKSLELNVPNGRDLFANKSSTPFAAIGPLIGRKVMTRWHEDNSFYEAIITNYNEHQDLHALVYNIHTNNETLEWVNLKEISPNDIRWIEDDIPYHPGGGVPGRGVRSSRGRGGLILGTGRGRGRGLLMNQPNNDAVLTQNGNGIKGCDDIKMLDIEALKKKVERVIDASYSDLLELERVKGALKEREQSLIDAISRLEDATNEGARHQLMQGQSMDPKPRGEERELLVTDG